MRRHTACGIGQAQRLINAPESLLDLNASMARMRNEEKFRIDDPLNNPFSATDSSYIGSWISFVSGDKTEEDTIGLVNAQRPAFLRSKLSRGIGGFDIELPRRISDVCDLRISRFGCALREGCAA
jgi:hypothetical protein